MTRLLKVVLYLFVPILAGAQSAPEMVFEPKINRVKIHLQGAEIHQEHSLNLNTGQHLLVFTGLSPKLYEKTVQLSISDDLEILSLSTKTNFLKKQELSPKVKQLKDSVKVLQRRIDVLHNEKTAYIKEREVLDKNQTLTQFNHNPAGTNDLAAAADFFRQRNLNIAQKLSELQGTLTELNQRMFDYSLELLEMNASLLPCSEIYLLVNCKKPIEQTLELSYIVGDAGWSAIYDLKAGEIGKEAELVYRARAYNNTGVDWKNVKLTLSTADPIQSITQPEMKPWDVVKSSQYSIERIATSDVQQTIETQDLNPYRGDVFKDVKRGSVQINATYEEKIVINTAFVQELLGDYYDRDIDYQTDKYKQYMQEQAKKNAPTVGLTTVELPDLSTDFEIEGQYTIPSDLKPYSIPIKRQKLPVNYGYYAVPKLDMNTYLVAKITEWEDLDLISGPVNIYNKNKYIGQSHINIRNLTDTLMLSLGRDSKVIVSREKVKGSSKKQFLGPNKIVNLEYSIKAVNGYSEPIFITIEDQIPISDDKEVGIELQKSSDAIYQQDIGSLGWQMQLHSGEAKTVNFAFSVKYPKGRTVSIQFSKGRAYGCPAF